MAIDNFNIDDRNREVIRKSLKDSNEAATSVENEVVNDALDYFERKTDHEAVRDKLTERGAVGIMKKEDEAGYETYTKQRIYEQIHSGEYETLTSGIGTTIINTISTLFTYPTQSWKYISTDDQQADEEEVAKLWTNRSEGDWGNALAKSDWVSNAVNTGPMLISWAGGHLNYRAFSPSCIYAKYHDTITDEGEERGVDYTDLEDATVVVIETNSVRGDGQSRPDLSSYVAFFGRSDEYEYGRMVQYTASKWDQWPEVGMAEANDWTTDKDEIANPLSWLAAQDEGYGVEYPIILIDGGVVVTSEIATPISTSLYENSREIDVAFSRLMRYSLANSLGTKVITNPTGEPLPTCLDGAIDLKGQQTFTMDAIPNSNAQVAWEITKGQSRAIAEGFGAPGYTILAESGGTAESGVALAIRTRPLIDNRNRRIRLNRSEVDRMYDIERGLYQVHSGEPLLDGVKQIWDPGRFIMPESQMDKVTRLNLAWEKNALDYFEYLMELHDLPTVEDAINMLIDRAQRKEEFAAENPDIQIPEAASAAPVQRPGLPPGIVPRGPRNVV
jgi:hypothetical protein